MPDKERSGVFKEMYMGLKWMYAMVLLIMHFELMAASNQLFIISLFAFVAYLILEIRLYMNTPEKLSKLSFGYKQSVLDQLFGASLILMYPMFWSLAVIQTVVFITILSFRSPKTTTFGHGFVALGIYTGLFLWKYNNFQMNYIEVGMQLFMVAAFCFVLNEIVKLFKRSDEQNRFIMEQIEQKNQLLEESSKTDFLTNMYNHQTFYNRLGELSVEHSPLSLILLDIDNFKMINDIYGHVSGDYVIREIAQLIKGNIRNGDVAARYGGEEFAVLLPNTELHEAFSIADRIRKAVGNRIFILDSEERHVTLSGGVGVAYHRLNNEKQSEFVNAIDSSLYKAKRSGKNKIIMYQAS